MNAKTVLSIRCLNNSILDKCGCLCQCPIWSNSFCFYWRTCGSRSKMAQHQLYKPAVQMITTKLWLTKLNYIAPIIRQQSTEHWKWCDIQLTYILFLSHCKITQPLYFPCPSKMIFCINHMWTDCYDFYLPYIKLFLPDASKSVCSGIKMLN